MLLLLPKLSVLLCYITVTRKWPPMWRYLGDVGESNEIGDEADHSNEDLLPGSQEMRILIHQGCNEPFHSAELREKVYTKDTYVRILA